ncbi:single-stranded DNA-binding protein [Stutzerimonas nitrititolerans]|uniref:single-stranded DNA-binding protein n=1 Tax=Stutzerimonas nitrititolerans TaxID=2482751 RepID=UPI002898B6C4|nr:single-stranded DNA-binding protein [Stutzerimonas nitrititolerans]
MAQLFGVARLGRDAELRFTQAGEPVATLVLAFEYGKKENGRKPTQWADAALWGKRAEALAPYLLKGQQVGVTVDDVHIEPFQKNDGTQGFKLTGRVSNIEFAGSPPQQSSKSQPQAKPQRQQTQRQAAPQPAPDYDSFDDDIPF